MCEEVTRGPYSWLVSIFIMPSLLHVIMIVHTLLRPYISAMLGMSQIATVLEQFQGNEHCLSCLYTAMSWPPALWCRHSGKGNVASKYCSYVEWDCCTAVVFRLLWYCHNWAVAVLLQRNCSISIATACMAADQCVSFAPYNVTKTWWCSLVHWHIALFTFTPMHCQFLHIYKG